MAKDSRETLVFRKDDEWVRETIIKIVEHKRAAGFRSSFSFEAIRLLKNQLLTTTVGAATDRAIIKGAVDDADS